MLIRPRADDDLPPLVQALVAVSATDQYPIRWPADPAAWLSPRDALGAWVAERDGVLVGQVVLRRAGEQAPVRLWHAVTGREPGECALISRLFVAVDFRGHGVGRALLDAACAGAVERGLHPVLDVVDDNQAAVRLYQWLGWTHLGSYSEQFYPDGPHHILHCFAAPTTVHNRHS